jgi:hypothetical protein
MVTHGDTREIRDPDSFVRAWADANGLDARARQVLTERLHEQVTWMRSLRRAAIVGRKVGAAGAQWEQALRMVHEQSSSLLQKLGRVELALQVDEVRTPEGFALPWNLDEDFESHALYCLARDGVVSLTLLAGVASTSISGLVELIARDGRRAGHNALTWLWSFRDPCISIGLGAWLTPHSARSLAAHDQAQPSYRAYLRVLTAAGSASTQALTPFVTPQDMSGLPDPAYDEARGHRLLLDGVAPGELSPPSPRTRLGFAMSAADSGLLERRLAVIDSRRRGY